MKVAGPSTDRRIAAQRPGAVTTFASLALLFLAALLCATVVGAAGIPLSRLPAALLSWGEPATAREQLILWSIRLPRAALAIMVGGLLALGGTLMQGLFRNPLADPALVGVSGGAALTAALAIVVGDRYLGAAVASGVFDMLPVAAFLGALAMTAILYRIATRHGRTSIVVFLLGGLAIGALASAATGLLVFAADDRQLRDITFWMLGSLGGATWSKVGAVLPFFVVLLSTVPLVARGLDLIALGEAEAFHAGVRVERLKRVTIVLIAAGVGAAVSVSGVIGFIGVMVPHLLRHTIGPLHRMLLPSAALCGATLLLLADAAARTIVAPAELPIGIVTAIFGAPFFLFLLLRQRSLVSL
jgi:iron complex transport system permease protein